MYEIENIRVKIPKPKYRVGQDLYNVWADDDGKCEITTHRIRTINKNGIYLVEIDKWTWINRAAIGKSFSKTENYGYADNISKWSKTHIRNPDDINKHRYWTTKLKAWQDKDITQFINEDEAAMKKAHRQIKTNISKLQMKR